MLLRYKFIFLAILVFSIGGCGGSGGSDPAPTQVNPPPAPIPLTWDNSSWDQLNWE